VDGSGHEGGLVKNLGFYIFAGIIPLPMKRRIFVAMSGGVDSSVAAALLKDAGFEVAGMTMDFSGGSLCSNRQNIEDARKVCRTLGIKHYCLNMQRELKSRVIKDFCREYLRGRTPNPCVRCNQYIKFGALLNKALSLGGQFFATGHYARVSQRPTPHSRHPEYILRKAKDKNKDQSYFLYRLNQKQLSHIIFPLGDYTKAQTRALAGKFHLTVAQKLASQEICFLHGKDYRGFLRRRLTGVSYKKLKAGPVVDEQGRILSKHKGIAFYTIGQREGLGIAKGYPLYITKINPKNNTITVGSKASAMASSFLIRQPHFIAGPLKKKVVLKVKIRYNHRETEAKVMPAAGKIQVEFLKPQFAITPGQSAVFFDADTIIGGGIIAEVLG